MKKNIKLNIFMGIIIICFIISIFILNIFSNKALPIFMEYVVSKVKNNSVALINRAIKEELNYLDNVEDMIIITKNSEDEIQMVDFDPITINKMLTSITKNILENIKTIENDEELFNESIHKYNKGVIYEVPIGIISNNVFLSNLGPEIPIKLNVIGDVFANVNAEVKEYGINNALIKISINVSVNEKVIIPFISQTVNISTSVPISIKLIQGNIPIYYGSGFQRNSNILSTPS